MSILKKIMGDPNAKVLEGIYPIVDRINSLEPTLQTLSDSGIKTKTEEFKDRLEKGESLNDILPEAFAVVREASRRTTGMRHFDVQLVGGIVLHRGQISEMRTGEGKTLVATLPIYLNALSGKGVHLVTVNDYLAKRDAVWMSQIYDFLGLSVGIIQNQMVSYRYNSKQTTDNSKQEEDRQGQESVGATDASPRKNTEDEDPVEGSETDKERDAKGTYKVEYEYLDECTRQEAYSCDIVYGTNNEFGFDYLRDNMVLDIKEKVQRELNFSIVDEVDSILVDEARTPLIISAPVQKAAEMYYQFAKLVERLVENEDYNVDEKMRAATLSDAGIKKMEGWLGVDNIYAEGGLATVHHVEQALKAKALFKLDKDYVIDGQEVVIVDEFTGRKMPGRRYSEGLHQAIEAKEGVEIQRESQTMATVTFQNYFRMYDKLAGMTGTAVTEAEEFGKIYKLEVVVIPTNKPIARVDKSDRIYKTETAKYNAIAAEVKELQAKGQPVLVGSASVDKNEALSLHLEREGIKHEILNAKNHEREGEIIAQAGRPGAVTLATNMAGRGVDIILGGNPVDEATANKVKAAGGLFVLGTERHESRRIDNQLRGRSGRQGDPGETQFYLSTDDDLMRIFAGERIKKVMDTLKVPEDTPIEQKSITKIIESAQKKVEGFNFDTRKHLLDYDDVINRHREVVYGKRQEILAVFEKEKAANPGLASAPSTSSAESVVQEVVPEQGKAQPAGVAEKAPETLREIILNYVEGEIEQVVSFHTNSEEKIDWNMQEVYETVLTIFPLSQEEKTKILEFSNKGAGKLEAIEERTRIIEYLSDLAIKKYDELLVKKAAHPEMLIELEKQILLRSIDNLWVDHLVAIDHLRQGIGLRGYGQRDPLVEYKKETYHMFNELLALIQKEVVYTIYKMSIGVEMAPSIMESGGRVLQGAVKTQGDHSEHAHVPTPKAVTPAGGKIGRNDPCYCGSGKKFKKCHGA